MIGARILPAALLAAATAGLSTPAAAQDAAAGAGVFQTFCAVCHSVDKPAQTKIGPSLVGVVGRKAGTLPGYGFSAPMKAYGQVWTAANLDAFLLAPRNVVPNTKMTFFGVKDPSKRAKLIAYLKAQK